MSGRVARDRDGGDRSSLARLRDARPGPGVMAVEVLDSPGMPTSDVIGQYLCKTLSLSGPESEGGAVGVSDAAAGAPVVVVVFGQAFAGDRMVAERHGGRWYAERQTPSIEDPPPECLSEVRVRVGGCRQTDGTIFLGGVTVDVLVAGVVVDTGLTPSYTFENQGYVHFLLTYPYGTEVTVEISGYPDHYVPAAATTTVQLQCWRTLFAGEFYPVPQQVTLGLSPEEGYRCCTPPCCPQPGEPPYPAVDWAETATVNDGLGDVTLAKTAFSSVVFDDPECTVIYTGTAVRPASGVYRCTDGQVVAGGDVTVGFALSCDTATGKWRLKVYSHYCHGQPGCYGPFRMLGADYQWWYPGLPGTPRDRLPTEPAEPAIPYSLTSLEDSGVGYDGCEINAVAKSFTFTAEVHTFGLGGYEYWFRSPLYWVYGDTFNCLVIV